MEFKLRKWNEADLDSLLMITNSIVSQLIAPGDRKKAVLFEEKGQARINEFLNSLKSVIVTLELLKISINRSERGKKCKK